MKKLTKAEQFVADMKKHRRIDFARLGMQIEVDGEIGTIVGMNSSANLDVVFANQQRYGKSAQNCHPFWQTRYFDKAGFVIADYREKEAQDTPPLPALSAEEKSLANELAMAAINEQGIERLDVTATLSIDKPESLHNFATFGFLLLQAFKKGQASAQAPA